MPRNKIDVNKFKQYDQSFDLDIKDLIKPKKKYVLDFVYDVYLDPSYFKIGLYTSIDRLVTNIRKRANSDFRSLYVLETFINYMEVGDGQCKISYSILNKAFKKIKFLFVSELEVQNFITYMLTSLGIHDKKTYSLIPSYDYDLLIYIDNETSKQIKDKINKLI